MDASFDEAWPSHVPTISWQTRTEYRLCRRTAARLGADSWPCDQPGAWKYRRHHHWRGDRQKPSGSITDLKAAIEAGSVKTLFVLGGNPAYNAPSDLNFSRPSRESPQSVRLGFFEDETSKLCRWHVPAAHYLEMWSDVRAYDGTYSVVQPMIPLLEWCQRIGDSRAARGATETARPGTRPGDFCAEFNADPEKWNSVLRVGFAPGSMAGGPAFFRGQATAQ